MSLYRDYSKKHASPSTKKKIPLGRFLILGALLWWGYSYFVSKNSTPSSQSPRSTSKSSSSFLSSSSALPPEIKVSRWQNEDQSQGARVDYYRGRLRLEDLLDTSRIPAQWTDFVVLSYQNCEDTSRVRVRFLSENDHLKKWSWECEGLKRTFDLQEGQWIDSLGCPLGSPCYGSIALAQSLNFERDKDRTFPHFYAVRPKEGAILRMPSDGVLATRSVSPENHMVFRLGAGYTFEVIGSWESNPTLNEGDRLQKGQVIGVFKKNDISFLRFHQDGYTRPLREILPWFKDEE